MSYTNWDTELLTAAINKAVCPKERKVKKVKNLKQKQARHAAGNSAGGTNH